MTSAPRRSFAFLITPALLAISVFAQSNVATITGIVTDQSGAAVPGCEVTVTNTATGTVSRIQTNTQGVYMAPSLIPGPYTVVFAAQGFNRREVKDIALRTGQQLRLDSALEVGNVAEAIEVTAQPAPTISTVSSNSRRSLSTLRRNAKSAPHVRSRYPSRAGRSS